MKLAACPGAEPFKYCAAPPLTLGFEHTTSGPASNPFTFEAFTFNASNSNAAATPSTNEIVTSTPDTQQFPAIASGNQALESTFTLSDPLTDFLPLTLKLDISGDATIAMPIGPFVAVSGYINSFKDIGQGLRIDVTGSLNGVDQASCFSEFISPGTLDSPQKVTFADATDVCIVDTLSLQNANFFPGSVGYSPISFSLDDFVVCKANTTSMQGAMPVN